jgi:hypothetical protein
MQPRSTSDRRRAPGIGILRWRLLLTLIGLAAVYGQAADVPTPAGITVCDEPQLRGTPVYQKYCTGGGSVNVPQGPSPEELRRRADAKDSREAADDAEDRGVAAYGRCDWSAAVQYFREALEYAPDDSGIRANLETAQRHLDAARSDAQVAELKRRAEASESAQELVAAAKQRPANASAEAHTTAARNVFDNKAAAAGTLSVAAPTAVKGDPIVPLEKRTPKITSLENDRQAARERIAAVDQKLRTLNSDKDAVVIDAMERDKDLAAKKVRRLNLCIETELSGAPCH